MSTQTKNIPKDRTTSIDASRSTDARDILNKEDKYAIENLLAKGGMAMVFKAKDKNCRRPVALKVINEADLQNQEVIHRFIEEAQIAAQLDHPNILPVYDLNIDKLGNPFYAMKLVKGDTLENIIIKVKQKDKKAVEDYPLSKLLQIYLKVCEAVAFAASKGVVHRDLKPENIMIGEYGEVFIMNWGIAKVFNEDEELPDAQDRLSLPATIPHFFSEAQDSPCHVLPTTDQIPLSDP